MALRYVAVSAAGNPTESVNDTADLVDAVATANAVAGSNADVTTELAAVTASIPSGAIVVAVDTDAVTTLNALRQLLDAAYHHVAASNLMSEA